jgi:tellurite methyltransferase
MDDFDREYRATRDVFGAEAENALVRFAGFLDPRRAVLDVGCGQGRNSLFLARRGIAVDALDPSPVAVEQVTQAAEGEALTIRTMCGSFQEPGELQREYGGILVFGLIPILTRVQIGDMCRFVDKHLGPGGLLLITAFGTWDPDFEVRSTEWTPEDRNSFRSLDGRLRTYLEPGELPALFPGLATVHTWEGLGPEHRHGDGPPERHGMAEAVMKREES